MNKKKDQKRDVIRLGTLYKATWLDISTFWRILGGILIVYAIVNFLFVASFSLLPSSESIQSDIASYLGDSAGRVIDSFALVGISLVTISAPSNTLLQVVLLLIASMALIWALRKLRGLQKIRIRQAYYEGPANIVPLVLVTMLLLLTLIPASIASTILLYALPIVGSLLERIVIYAIGSGLLILTIYWLLVWWPALYISMLPGTTPLASMRAAASLTKGRRIKIWTRQFAIFITASVVFMFVVLPLAIVLQRAVPLAVYTMLVLLFGLMHVALFNLYRSLIDDPTQER